MTARERLRVLVTCGPAISPIDEVRRITNFSTGSFGLMLANTLAAAGCEVVCFKGEAATTPLAAHPAVEVRPFSTNDDLLAKLRAVTPAGAVFHAAALCDYDVEAVRDSDGALRNEAKIPSRAGSLTLVLRPALKVLPVLRDMFPHATIVGWKYELNGSREDALSAATRQIRESRTNVCVVNGASYGDGYGILNADGTFQHAVSKEDVCSRFKELLLRDSPDS